MISLLVFASVLRAFVASKAARRPLDARTPPAARDPNTTRDCRSRRDGDGDFWASSVEVLVIAVAAIGCTRGSKSSSPDVALHTPVEVPPLDAGAIGWQMLTSRHHPRRCRSAALPSRQQIVRSLICRCSAALAARGPCHGVLILGISRSQRRSGQPLARRNVCRESARLWVVPVSGISSCCRVGGACDHRPYLLDRIPSRYQSWCGSSGECRRSTRCSSWRL